MQDYQRLGIVAKLYRLRVVTDRQANRITPKPQRLITTRNLQVNRPESREFRLRRKGATIVD
jgi:hypothetical protein